MKKLPRELRNLAIPDRDWKDLLPPTKQATERSAKPVREDGDDERGELLYVASDDGPSSVLTTTLLPPTTTLLCPADGTPLTALSLVHSPWLRSW